MPSSRASAKGSTSSSAGANDTPLRPSETPKDLKKRVSALNKSLASVHERLIQTEKQIFDLERSYLEETRLYGNVLQGWDAYLDTKGKGKMGESLGTKRARKDCADAAGGEEDAGEGNGKRAKGVELEERLFSLGSVTSPAAKGLQKQEEKRRASGREVGSAGGGRPSSPDSGNSPSKVPRTPKTPKLPKSPKDKKTDGKGATEAETAAAGAESLTAVATNGGGRSSRKDSARKDTSKKDSAKKDSAKKDSSKKKKRTR